MKINNPIYLDLEGYNELNQKIENKKKEIYENNKGRNAAFSSSSGDGWDSPEFENLEQRDDRLNSELLGLYDLLKRVVIVEKHNDKEIVDIGDVIVANIIFSSDDIEELTFKLVGADGDFDTEIQEISINSPLGSAVYKKKMGDTCHYSVNDTDITVILKQKMDLTKENDFKVKK